MSNFIPSLERRALQLIRENAANPLKRHALAEALGLETAEERALLRQLLRELEQSGKIVRLRGNRWAPTNGARPVVGTLRVHPSGFGFVSPEDPEFPDIYIPEEAIGVALDGDLVLVQVDGRKTSNLRRKAQGDYLRGRVIRVVQRRRTRIVGRLCETRWYRYVIPDNPHIPHNVRITETKAGFPKVGHKVVVDLQDWKQAGTPLSGVIVEDLGPVAEPGLDILSILKDHRIECEFPESVIKEAQTVARLPIEGEFRHRRDLRDELIFTIDPPDAKDYDDAVSLQLLPGQRFRLGVHIADVSFYVQPGSALDREALLRGNSVYMVDRCIPMLPPELSSDACSLNAGKDRLTHTIDMIFDARGRLVSFETYPSVIRSAAQLSYEEVQTLFDHNLTGDIPEPVAEVLLLMRKFAALLRERRMREGSLDLWMPEIKCVLDEVGTPVDLVRRGADEAYNLIEEFMLAANRVVAGIMASRRVPAIYRIHPPPSSKQWQWMAEELAALGIKLREPTRDELNRIAREYAKSEQAHIVHVAILRNLKRACYSGTLSEHFGLAFDCYTHFTSPIRRYPDLVVHRILKAIENNVPPPVSEMEAFQISEHCSWTERNADEAEEESLDVKRLEYFSLLVQRGEIGPYQGVIVGITPRGLLVELTDSLLRGLLSFKDLGHERFFIDDQRTMARAHRGRKIWKLGQLVNIYVVRVDRLKRQVDLLLADEQAPHSKRKRKRV